MARCDGLLDLLLLPALVERDEGVAELGCEVLDWGGGIGLVEIFGGGFLDPHLLVPHPQGYWVSVGVWFGISVTWRIHEE